MNRRYLLCLKEESKGLGDLAYNLELSKSLDKSFHALSEFKEGHGEPVLIKIEEALDGLGTEVIEEVAVITESSIDTFLENTPIPENLQSAFEESSKDIFLKKIKMAMETIKDIATNAASGFCRNRK